MGDQVGALALFWFAVIGEPLMCQEAAIFSNSSTSR
jgi:hypothetical protein